MKKKRKTKYMHILNGQPASFCETQICFAGLGQYGQPIKMCDSLDDLRAEQKASEEWRESEGLELNGDTLEYIKVAL